MIFHYHAEGATQVRIGTALFGPRTYPNDSHDDHPLGASFPVRVQPRAARTAITGTVSEYVKLFAFRAAALRRDPSANLAVVEFFSEIFSVPRSTVKVVAGERSRNKVIQLRHTGAELQRRLREHFTV